MATLRSGARQPRAEHARSWQVQLFDSFALRRGAQDVPLRSREQRTVAVLALHGSRPRSYLAGVLWPDSTERRAGGSLRASIWRLERAAPGLLVSDRAQLTLSPDVDADVTVLSECAAQIGSKALRRGTNGSDDLQVPNVLLSGELLPGWYDDWVTYERARLQQLRLRMLEALTEALVARSEYSTAVTTAMAALAIEPLRESAQRALISVHIAEGNYHEALREYYAFRKRLAHDLGVAPSARLEAIVEPLLAARRDRPASAGLRTQGLPATPASAPRAPLSPATNQHPRSTPTPNHQRSRVAAVHQRADQARLRSRRAPSTLVRVSV